MPFLRLSVAVALVAGVALSPVCEARRFRRPPLAPYPKEAISPYASLGDSLPGKVMGPALRGGLREPDNIYRPSRRSRGYQPSPPTFRSAQPDNNDPWSGDMALDMDEPPVRYKPPALRSYDQAPTGAYRAPRQARSKGMYNCPRALNLIPQDVPCTAKLDANGSIYFPEEAKAVREWDRYLRSQR